MELFDTKTFNAEVFGRYADAIPNVNLNELYKSRAIKRDSRLKALFAPQTGSFKGTLPYFGKLKGDPDNYDGETDISASTPDTFNQEFVVIGRAKGFLEKDFSSDITGGVKFMDKVAEGVAEYWAEVYQNGLLSVLKGIFAMSATGDVDFVNQHTTDISGTGASSTFGATTLNTALQKASGDAKSQFSIAFMHSKVATDLENLQLLEYLKYTDKSGIQRNLALATLNGRIVIVDDGMPILQVVGTAGVYTVKIDTNAASTDKITIFGEEWVAGTDFTVGVNAGATATNLKNALAAKTTAPYTNYTYSVESDTVTITGKVNLAVYAKPAVTKKSGTIVLTYTEATEPVYTYNYTTYVLGDGALTLEDVGAKVPYEMARNAAHNGGETTLYSRKRFVIAPDGISFKGTPAKKSPTTAELETGSNWCLVNNGQNGADKEFFPHKKIAIARIITR